MSNSIRPEDVLVYVDPASGEETRYQVTKLGAQFVYLVNLSDDTPQTIAHADITPDVYKVERTFHPDHPATGIVRTVLYGMSDVKPTAVERIAETIIDRLTDGGYLRTRPETS